MATKLKVGPLTTVPDFAARVAATGGKRLKKQSKQWTWHYGVVKTKDGYAVHEVYMDGKKLDAMAQDPVTLVAFDDKESLIWSLEMMLKDVKEWPTFRPPKRWK